MKTASLTVVALALALAGCVSFGEEPPATLLSLTPAASAPAGDIGSGTVAEAIAVVEPEAPRRLDVVRVPVQVDDSTVAYLKDAVWIEKPARLFGRLLAESLRAHGERFVVEGVDEQYAAASRLSGQLAEMGYDARSASVVVRFDAVLRSADGTLRTRRFEASVGSVLPQVGEVGPALNRASNDVAQQVAAWVG